MTTPDGFPDAAATNLVDDGVVHFILCLPEQDRADAAEMFAVAMVSNSAPAAHQQAAEDIINAPVSPDTGRLSHLNPTDRLFVLRTIVWARDSRASQRKTGWGIRR